MDGVDRSAAIREPQFLTDVSTPVSTRSCSMPVSRKAQRPGSRVAASASTANLPDWPLGATRRATALRKEDDLRRDRRRTALISPVADLLAQTGCRIGHDFAPHQLIADRILRLALAGSQRSYQDRSRRETDEPSVERGIHGRSLQHCRNRGGLGPPPTRSAHALLARRATV